MAKLYYGELHEVGGGHPGHLPAFPGRPIDPGYGIEEGGVDNALPPGTVWPPIVDFPDWALRPDQGLPGGGGSPDQSLPGAGGERPDQGLPGRPGGGGAQLKKVWAFVWIRGYGHRWVVLDISARPLPTPPPVAQPKT
jgi:hypothetical protein